VVSGHGLIRERKIGSDEVIEYEVSGEKIQAVYMIPGHTHSIINLSNNENLVMLIWANEPFNPNFPDTFYEPVV
jgi:UDP-2-acetamido-2,6-beta-L-arabino-hexul-4-ose reductase